ncbi:UDP-N-acetylglucosamine transferase subunit ALG14 homolog isoform X2 [Mustela lutreola]|uniref:UDP-N-acetylglucosamine transferase subunit ALG14 homolog isoform X2 n=1 Tax=Mustela lutreola TaxID=9666 RepID=UPI002797676F|nr:UDP-N-acetylglucosamine transferase subunit ALG14 homolog isoform X2 [Mustela lutreola]
MASVLILVAAGAAVAALLALRLWVVLHSRVLGPRQSCSLLVVAGSGGHTTEILRLLENLSNAYSPRHYIIADTDEMSAHKIHSFEQNRADTTTMLSEYYIHRIPRSREVQQSWLSTVLTTLYSMWLSFPLTHKVKPDLTLRLGISSQYAATVFEKSKPHAETMCGCSGSRTHSSTDFESSRSRVLDMLGEKSPDDSSPVILITPCLFSSPG